MPPKRRARAKAGADDSPEVAKIRQQFRALDVNNDGTLSFGEMRRLLKSLHKGFSERQLQQLFCEIDGNQNGKVEVSEFIDFIFKGKKSEPEIPREPPPEKKPPIADVRPEWKAATCEAHNKLRALHDTGPLEWSDECYAEAKKQADACQAKSSLFHGFCEGPSGRHGQNAYWCSMPGRTADSVCRSWYSEIDDPGYDWAKPSTRGVGHFTQVVWKGTTHVGMAVSQCGCFVVANYWPAGNMIGAYPANVLPLSGSPPPKAAGGPRPSARPREPSPPPSEPAADGEEINVHKVFESMTPEMEALFKGCPFDFQDRCAKAFSDGSKQISIKLESQGRKRKMEVIIAQGGGYSMIRGAWGGG